MRRVGGRYGHERVADPEGGAPVEHKTTGEVAAAFYCCYAVYDCCACAYGSFDPFNARLVAAAEPFGVVV